MGRTVTPTFVVKYRDQQGPHTVIWNTKTAGRPNPANLEKWRKLMNASMKLGGVNEHVSKALGFMPHCSNAEIVNQKTGVTVCSVAAPMFEIV